MPRKVFHGVDYGDDYDDYDDYYDYEDGDEAEFDGKARAPAPTKDAVKRGTWSCPICTYDNEENMPACDICGVLRNPLPHLNNNHNKQTGVSTKVIAMKESSNAPIPAKASDSSSIRKQGRKTDTANENSHLKIGEPKLQSSIKASESSSASKGSVSSLDSSSKFGSGNEQFEDQVSGTSGRHYLVAESPSSFEEIRPQTHNRGMSNSSLRSKSQAPYKPEKWMLPEKGGSDLSQLNLAIVGHVDSGKSTLSGRLLHHLGRISQKQMHKYEKEAKLQGKGSFAYAWALDESPEERERGITMTVGVAYFDTKNYHVVVLDSPGHKDFVPNMISGATQADAAILVIDASVGAFEAGVDPTKGQTREHAQLIRSFGVDQLIVAINKMDVVNFSEERFETIKKQLGVFLRICGFKDSYVAWIPLSVMENQNLASAPTDARFQSWYRGPHLLDAIDSMQPPTRDISKPVVMPICDFVKSQATGQVSAVGKLEAGALRIGSKVLIMPSGDVGTVKTLERASQSCTVARSGDNVAVVLQGVEEANVMSGDVLCHPDFPVPVSMHYELKVLVLDGSAPILIGSQVEFHVHHAKEAARVVKITSLLDSKTGKVTKRAPRCLVAKQTAILEVVLDRPVCADEYSNCKALGRVSLRSLGRTVAVGVVSRLIED